MATKPCLSGRWADAFGAIRFYEKHGYRLLARADTERLLKQYWKIPERQIATSVVLASPGWESAQGTQGRGGVPPQR